MSRTVTQAPSVNFETRTTASVIAVQIAPRPLIDHRPRRARAAIATPVLDHPRLRERERQEGPHGEQRDQGIGDPSEDDEQGARQSRQDQDAVRVDQPAAPVGEGVGQEAVLRDHPAEAGEVGEPGVGRQRQHRQHRADRDVVEDPLAHDRRDELRQHALVPRPPGLGGADAIGPAEEGDAGQEDRQQRDDRRQGAARVADRRLAERGDAVADRLDARHRRAAAGERPHQDPQRRADRGRGERRRRDHRLRAARPRSTS